MEKSSKQKWNGRASGKDGCQAFLTYHFVWSEIPHIPGVITEDVNPPLLLFHLGLRILWCCSQHRDVTRAAPKTGFYNPKAARLTGNINPEI